jgi:large subunit ribosomal protein L10
VLISQVAGLLMSPIQRMAGVVAALAKQRGGGDEAEVANDAAAETPAAA